MHGRISGSKRGNVEEKRFATVGKHEMDTYGIVALYISISVKW